MSNLDKQHKLLKEAWGRMQEEEDNAVDVETLQKRYKNAGMDYDASTAHKKSIAGLDKLTKTIRVMTGENVVKFVNDIFKDEQGNDFNTAQNKEQFIKDALYAMAHYFGNSIDIDLRKLDGFVDWDVQKYWDGLMGDIGYEHAQERGTAE